MAGPVQIDNGIFWVGKEFTDSSLSVNPYLIIDGDDAVLIDPGSVLDFDEVYKNVSSLIPMEKLKYVILQHEDPDLCGSVTLFEKHANFQVLCHWRTKNLVSYYGIKSPYMIFNMNSFNVKLASGRMLDFIPTPYLHFAGSIATYDRNSKILFSSDLFGAFSEQFSLFVENEDNYIEQMKTFHEHYMPSNEILRPVMETFLSLDIKTIAPQHGSIIQKNVPKYINALRELECGAFLKPIKRSNIKKVGYSSLISTILKRFSALAGSSVINEALMELNVKIDPISHEVLDYSLSGPEIWNLVIEKLFSKSSKEIFIAMEPLIQNLCTEYNIPLPNLLDSTIKKNANQIDLLKIENKKLHDTNKKLDEVLTQIQEQLIKCPITGIYNQNFFDSYLKNSLDNPSVDRTSALLLINIDDLERIKFSYGDKEVEQVLQNIVYVIKNITTLPNVFARLDGGTFGLLFPEYDKDTILIYGEKLRVAVEQSELFVEKMTISIGVAFFKELQKEHISIASNSAKLYSLAMSRLNLARKRGMNIVISSIDGAIAERDSKKILIVDTDTISTNILSNYFKSEDYEVLIARDGLEAYELALNNLTSLIITEIMLPKQDGFYLREKLLSNSQTRDIPFIVISYDKSDNSIKRALSLNIVHFFQKPFNLIEIMGISKILLKGES